MDGSLGIGFHREDGFIRLHLHHLLAIADLGSILDQPLNQRDFLDRLPQLGNEKFFSHQLTTFRHAAKMRPTLGMALSSSISARGTGTLAEATRTIGASK